MTYSVVLGITAVVALALPFVIVRRRATPGAVPFALLLVAAAEWAGVAALEHAASASATKVLWAKLEYPGISALAPLWLTFALAYTGRDAWLTRRRAAVLWLVPALTVAFAWTNEWHHLVWTSITPVSPASGAALAYGHGAWFWTAAAYAHVLLVAGTLAILVALVRFRACYRRQTVALVVGLALPWIGNALYLGGWRVLEGRDPTPLAFTLTGLVYALGVFGFGLLDLVPLAGVAHELNNPPSVIVGHASLLRRHVAEGPVAARVEKIATAAERCARIVRNFLSVARQPETERAAIDLNRGLNDAVDFLAYPMQVDDVRLVLELAPDLPPVWADAQQIHQVAVNILANAHHAVRTAGSPRRVTLASWAAADRRTVDFRVSETAPGYRKRCGRGSSSRSSRRRRSATASPCAAASWRRTTGGSRSRAARAPAGPAARGRRILVVDDEPMVAEILGEILTGYGHYVDTAGDGRVALEKLAAGRFDLVLTDVKMPGLDGPGFYRHLVARDPGARRRVIFVSGDTPSDETRAFLAGTGAPLLHKPFDTESVRRAVDAALGAAG